MGKINGLISCPSPTVTAHLFWERIYKIKNMSLLTNKQVLYVHNFWIILLLYQYFHTSFFTMKTWVSCCTSYWTLVQLCNLKTQNQQKLVVEYWANTIQESLKQFNTVASISELLTQWNISWLYYFNQIYSDSGPLRQKGGCERCAAPFGPSVTREGVINDYNTHPCQHWEGREAALLPWATSS